MTHQPLVAIVGRPNVGKSTFFNKIAGRRIAIVKDTPGVTRDRIYASTQWNGRAFTMIDTGGIDTASDDQMLLQIRAQAQIAIETADVICFFTDARDGLTHQDEEIAQLLRRSKKPILLVVNKLDYAGLNDQLIDYYSLGLGDPIGISSTNMLGLGDLLDEIVRLLPPPDSREDEEQAIIQVALVGRPNVGKSSLTNRLLGQQRMAVSDIPGTTRDAVDTPFVSAAGQHYNIIDTAGIRRKNAIEPESLERYSVLRSFAAINRCHVALLILDAQEGVTTQDERIAGMIKEEGKAAVIIVNKWDAVKKETGTFETYRKQVLSALDFMHYAPVLFVSALTGQRLDDIWLAIDQVYGQYTKRITTGTFNDFLTEAQMALQPPASGARRLKVYHGLQQGVEPPTFILFVNDAQLMHFSYARYLENQLRQTFDFTGTPVRFLLRDKKEDA